MILLVDDDASFLQQASAVLADSKVMFARDGAQARSLMESISFSVVMVDLNLPDCNAFQLIKEISMAQPQVPIVAFSGVFSDAVLESSKAMGATETLSKPVTAEWRDTVARLSAERTRTSGMN